MSARTLNEQWHPAPARLVRAIMEAPTARRRQWAIEYRTMWEVVFHKASRGESVKLRELMAWAGCTNKDRATEARKDALKSFQRWENAESSRTDLGQDSDKTRTEVSASKVENQGAVGQVSDKSRTLARALPSTDTNYRSTSGGDRRGSTQPPAPPASTSPSNQNSDLSQGEVQARSSSESPVQSAAPSPESKCWTSPAAFWPIWQAAWRQAGSPNAPQRGGDKIPRVLQAFQLDGVTHEEATALIAAWLTDDDRWPRDGIPAIGHLPSVYRTYLKRVRRRQRPTIDFGDLDNLPDEAFGLPAYRSSRTDDFPEVF